MAEVFLASREGTNRPMVVKAILPHLTEDQRFVDMFMREARVASMLSHPNIVEIYDVVVLNQRPCIVMEFLRGRDLWAVVGRLSGEGRATDPRAAAAVIAQAASALDYAHTRTDTNGNPIDLVHRDISPHNLFLTRDGQVKVLDFGIAKSAYQEQRTEAGVVKGKLSYMAPEQARGQDVDHRADQFALGVVLWEMLTLKRLFARDDPVDTMRAMFHEPIPKPSDVLPVPRPLEQVVMQALSRNPTNRFESCEAMARSLRAYLAAQGEGQREKELVKEYLADAIPPFEDVKFYSEVKNHTGRNALVEGDELTPSHSGFRAALNPTGEQRAVPKPPPPPPPPKQAKKKSALPLWFGGAAIVLVAGAIGVALATGDDAEVAPTSATPAANAEPVTLRFVGAPAGVIIELDGENLEGYSLEMPPGPEVHHIRALSEGVELWRYDAIVQRDMTVQLPPLSMPSDEAPRTQEPIIIEDPEPEPTRPAEPPTQVTRPDRTPRMNEATSGSGTVMRRPGMRRRLSMDIDLDYP